MPKTLLVVDGRGLPRPLTERLGTLGYVCLYARGPLRARTLLSQHTVDLILWKDNTGNRDLSGDLFAEWRRHPLVPVVRLYAKGLTAPAGADPPALTVALAANLPAEAPDKQLLAAIRACLESAATPVGESPGNELAFRHVVATLREHPAHRTQAGASALPENADPPAGLSPSERELLREQAAVSGSVTNKLSGPWRRVWNRWVGFRRTSAGP
jgi:DNA-binding response OmpR family regulator